MLFLYQKPIMNMLVYTPIIFRIIDISFYNHYNILPPLCKKIIYDNTISYFEISEKYFKSLYKKHKN